MADPVTCYVLPARLLHWAMAGLIAITWALGYYAATLSYADGPAKVETIMLHKTCGIAILILLTLRITIRLLRHPPPLPASVTAFQQRAAALGHRLLYALMLLVPVTGMLHSAQQGYGTPVFGLFVIPPPFEKSSPLAPVLGGIHEWIVWAFLALVLGHALMALKHQWVDRDGLLGRMGFGRMNGGKL